MFSHKFYCHRSKTGKVTSMLSEIFENADFAWRTVSKDDMNTCVYGGNCFNIHVRGQNKDNECLCFRGKSSLVLLPSSPFECSIA